MPELQSTHKGRTPASDPMRRTMNPHTHRFARTILGILCACCGAAVEAQRTPAWLDAAMERSDPDLESGNHATLIHEDTEIVVRSSGRIDTSISKAVRINTAEGRAFAAFNETYNEESDRITRLRIWIVHSDGSVDTFSQRDCSDRSTSSQRHYGEGRRIRFPARAHVRPGAVFAYEFSTRRRTSFVDHQQYWQGLLPVLYQRLAVVVPHGWGASVKRINGAVVDGILDGNRYEWEARSVPPVVVEESHAPGFGNLAARLALIVHPPAGSDTRGEYQIFENWNEVAEYAARENNPQIQPDDAIRRKAVELTADAESHWDRIAAIARFAQSVNYVSIQMGVTHGGGYAAFQAPDVLRRNYGDCKDKTALMRSLLAAVGIDSYAVAVRAGSLRKIEAGWPSLFQFDHMVVAVRAEPEIEAPTLVDDPVLGRLLIFDPTDPFTPLGDLMIELQGSRGLVATTDPAAAPLIRLPVVPAGHNRLTRRISATLQETGRLDVRMTERFLGHDARFERVRRHRFRDTDYHDRVRARIVSDLGAVRIGELLVTDDFDGGAFECRAQFSSLSHARVIGNRLLVFRPILLSRHGWTPPPEERINPIEFYPSSFSETIAIALPDGYEVDELPNGIRLSESFGEYSVTFTIAERAVHVTRSIEIERSTLPASDYDLVRRFYSAVADTEQVPVVLAPESG